jgi:hypothetical protein
LVRYFLFSLQQIRRRYDFVEKIDCHLLQYSVFVKILGNAENNSVIRDDERSSTEKKEVGLEEEV